MCFFVFVPFVQKFNLLLTVNSIVAAARCCSGWKKAAYSLLNSRWWLPVLHTQINVASFSVLKFRYKQK